MKKIKLCQLTQSDMEEVKNLGLEVQEEIKPNYFQPDDNIILNAINSGLSFCMRMNSEIIAYFLLCPDYIHQNVSKLLPDHDYLYYVAGVMVKKPFRRRGMAFQLAQISFSEIKNRNTTLIWTTVSINNLKSDSLFRKLGFEFIDETKVYRDQITKSVVVKNIFNS